MASVFVDRESAYPNRYRVIPESGEAYYVVLERADEAVTPGTPLNAETFNRMRDEIDAELVEHTGNKNNPHGVTPAQIGALPIAGGDATGNIRVKKSDPYFSLCNTDSGDILGLHYYGKTTGKNTFGVYDHTGGRHLLMIDQASGKATAVGGFDANNSKVINVATPTADTDAANKAYVDGVAKTRRNYVASGQIYNSANGTVAGFGTAFVTIDPTGLARVDFSVWITVAGTNVSNFDYGLNSNMLTDRNPNIPHITPFRSGNICVYDANGVLKRDIIQYGCMGDDTTLGCFWVLARGYDQNGSIGKWPETRVNQDDFITGTVYGTVEL